MEKKKSVVSNMIIITLILIIFVASAIGIYAWARIREKFSDTATAQVARWSFKIVDGVAETSDVIDFAVTRTDTNQDVTEGNIAPGTYGEFEIGIDARGTETILEYAIEVALTNKPTNLKLYSDSGRTAEIEVTDDIISLSGFMSLEDVDEIKVEKIYWEWPFETGESEEEILANDLVDAEFLGKTISMEIAVTGTEVLEETLYLADVVNVGDFVNYDASSNGVKTFTSSDCAAGSSISGTFSSSDVFNTQTSSQWRVLSVDKAAKTVELISADPTPQTLTLSGADGFINAEKVINNISEIYGQGKGAIGARSMTADDIDKYSSYVKTSNALYAKTKTFTNGTFFRQVYSGDGNVVGYDNVLTTATSQNTITITHTFYNYRTINYFSDSTVYNLMFINSFKNTEKIEYFLNSRCAFYSNGGFFIRKIYGGQIGGTALHYSNGVGGDATASVMSIVSLKPYLKTSGQDENGVWQLKVD